MNRRIGRWFVASCVAVLAIGALYHFAGVAAQEGKEPKVAKEPVKEAGGVSVTPSQVTSVTVYPLTAMVTREADVPAGKGVIELTISPLPSAAIISSLNAEGSDGIRVLTTRFRARTVTADHRDELKKFQDELATLATAREKVEGDVKAVQENLKTLAKMEGFLGVTTIQSAEKGALNAEAAITLVKYVKESRMEMSRELVTLEQQVKANQAKAAAIQVRMTEVGGGQPRTERDAVVVVDRAGGMGGKVKLHYLVDQASWRPQYKLRAGKTATDPVQIEFLAALVQNSGEDWGNVQLVLSTAQPMLNAAPPDLQSLRVGVVHKSSVATAKVSDPGDLEEQIRSLRNKAQKDINERKPTTGIGLFNTAAALDQSFELLNPDSAIQRGCALVVREGPTITYRVTTPLMLPTRTEEQVVEVARAELAPEFYYKSVPLITTQVYRLADFVNKSERVILPGEATMYVGSDFVGQMSLPLVAIGEKFTAGFGIDPQLQVKRQIVNKQQTTQGGNQMLHYEYRTTVDNYKNEKVKLQVWDRLPRPETDAVTVSILKTSPEISKDPAYLRGPRTQNLLRWDVTVDANATGEKALAIQYEFKMELDRQMTISDLQSAGAFAKQGPITVASLAPVSPAELARIQAAMAKLSPEDQKLAGSQVFCAIDQDARLGSMGPIQKLMLKGQPVFLCCKGCAAEATAHPDETILKVQNLMSRMKK